MPIGPDEVQRIAAHALGCEAKDMTVVCRRMGGAFGGKESQAALIATIAALMAGRTGRPCKLRLDRDVDMIMTGKRHDFDLSDQRSEGVEQEREEKKRSLISELEKGQVRMGVVKNITDFGAFVELERSVDVLNNINVMS